jgi:pimeloyl-ACP methyl ester carboxylesterase
MKRALSAYVPIAALAFLPGASLGQGSLRADSSATDLERLEANMAFLRQRNVSDYAVVGRNSIDEGRYVVLGGMEQWITIRGEDRNNPVLLFLHGGPGDVTNPWSYGVFRPWLEYFTVVQWDQRGAGRTLGRNGPPTGSSITVEQLIRDGLELSEWLRTNLAKDRIVVVGHSWGSILGVLMAKSRPDLFYAYVGTGQVADPSRSYAVAYTDLLSKAEAADADRALAELTEIGPPPYVSGRGYSVQRKWSNFFEGADVFLYGMVGLALVAPGSSPKDVLDWMEGQSVSAEQLVPQSSRIEAERLAGEFAIPVFVFQGAEDFTTPTSLAAAFIESIDAPSKAFVTIDGGHFAVFTHSGQFLTELVNRVRPLASSP